MRTMAGGVWLRLRLEGLLRRAPDIFEELLGFLVTVLGFLVTVLALREGIWVRPKLVRCLPKLVVGYCWALASEEPVMFLPLVAFWVSTPFRVPRTRKESLGLNAVFNTVKVRFINGGGASVSGSW